MPPSQEKWLQGVMKNNLSLHVSLLQLHQARREKKSIRSSYLPNVDAVASYAKSDDSTEVDTRNISLQATWIPFQGGGLRSRVRQAELNVERAMKDYSGLQSRVRRDARNLYKTLETDTVRIAAQLQATRSNESALEATQAGYEVGTRNVVDVLQAQRSLFRAKRDYATARYTFVLNLLQSYSLAAALDREDFEKIAAWTNKEVL